MPQVEDRCLSDVLEMACDANVSERYFAAVSATNSSRQGQHVAKASVSKCQLGSGESVDSHEYSLPTHLATAKQMDCTYGIARSIPTDDHI